MYEDLTKEEKFDVAFKYAQNDMDIPEELHGELKPEHLAALATLRNNFYGECDD